jgi:hypothetical protein
MSGVLAGRVGKALREGYEEEKKGFFPQKARKEVGSSLHGLRAEGRF